MLNAWSEDKQPRAVVSLTILATLMLSVSLSVRLTLSVRETRLASTISVVTLVLGCVEHTHPAPSTITTHSVDVTLATQGMLLYHAAGSQLVSLSLIFGTLS